VLPEVKLRRRKPRTANAITGLPQTKDKLPSIIDKCRHCPSFKYGNNVVDKEYVEGEVLPWGRMDLSLPKLMEKLVDGIVRTNVGQELKPKSGGDVLLPTKENYCLNNFKIQEHKVKSISDVVSPIKVTQRYSNQGFKNVATAFDIDSIRKESLPKIRDFRSSLALVQQHHDHLKLRSKLPHNRGSRPRVVVMPPHKNCSDI